jgi:hypothetical protein
MRDSQNSLDVHGRTSLTLVDECLDETDKKAVLKRIFLLFMLIDLAFSHGDQPQAQALKLFDKLIAEYKQLPLLTLVFAKLHQLYYQPNLGDDNRHKIEQLMTDIHLKINGVKAAQKGQSGTFRQKFLKNLHFLREESLKRDSSPEDVL